MKSIKIKLIVFMLLMSIIPLLIAGAVSYNISSSALKNQTEESLSNMTNQVYDMVEQVQMELEKEIRGYIEFMTDSFYNLGNVRMDESAAMATGSYNLPTLVTDKGIINNNYEFVDRIKEFTGANATVFLLRNNELVRISTNVKMENGERAVGTAIKSDSIVYRTIKEGKTFIGRANVVGHMNITAYAPIKDSEGSIIGAVFIGRPEDEGTLAEKIKSLKIGKTGYIFVMDSNADIIINESNDNNQKNSEYINEIIAEKDGLSHYKWKGQNKISVYRYFEKWDWYIVASVLEEEVFEAVSKLMIIMIAVTAVCMILVLAVGYLIAASLAKPIKNVVSAFEKMKSGDLTVKVEAKSKDEVGLLASSFNIMTENLRNIIKDIQISSESVSEASGCLSIATEESNKSISEVAASIMHISNDSQDNAASIQQTLAGVEEVTSSAQIIAKSSNEIAELSKGVEQSAESGASSVKSVAEKINNISASFNSVISLITELNSSTGKINDIIEFINGISNQTNMLALNAAIEAARAGEAGKGFAVVADEVRKLAEESKHSTNQIVRLIEDVQLKTAKVIEAVKSSELLVEEGVVNADSTYMSIKEILESIKKVSSRMSSISSSTEMQAQTAEQISKAIEAVALSTGSTASKTQEINAGIEEQLSIVEEIESTAQEMSNMALKLNQIIKNFKI